MTKKFLTLGLSPCPNDTFIFYPLLERKINSPIEIKPYFADVEDLNNKTIRNQIELSKISIAAYPKISENYWLLRCGGAMGYSCGPLLLNRISSPLKMADVENSHILVPGLNTTAVLYLKLAFPGLVHASDNKDPEKRPRMTALLFSDIMNYLNSGKGDFGLIIHESRFTFDKYRLKEVLDLGSWWEKETGLPIPLGGIAASRNLDPSLLKELEEAIANSIRYSWNHQDEALEFCKKWAQEMDNEVLLNHIKLYVNDFSIDFTEQGKNAILSLFKKAREKGIIENIPEKIFI